MVELGCGCGLLGLTAAGLGVAAEVVLTDQVLFMAQRNLERNFSAEERAAGGVRVAQLSWGDSDDIWGLLDSSDAAGFDVLMGADIIYHAESHGALAETLSALSHDGSLVLWATQVRAPPPHPPSISQHRLPPRLAVRRTGRPPRGSGASGWASASLSTSAWTS